nr:MAG TPA: hypothetical protein [Caudoviricetes sp.]
MEWGGIERNRNFKKYRFYRRLIGTCGIGRNEKESHISRNSGALCLQNRLQKSILFIR